MITVKGADVNKARRYAESVLQHYWDKKIPVCPKSIIEKIGDVVLKEEVLSENVSGKVAYDRTLGKYVITINKNHSENKQRFTMAYELGHYALEHGNREDVLYRSDLSLQDKSMETEANAFAAELLMPAVAIRHLIFEEGVVTVQELARRFWVSEAAMSYRLKNLGLVS